MLALFGLLPIINPEESTLPTPLTDLAALIAALACSCVSTCPINLTVLPVVVAVTEEPFNTVFLLILLITAEFIEASPEFIDDVFMVVGVVVLGVNVEELSIVPIGIAEPVDAGAMVPTELPFIVPVDVPKFELVVLVPAPLYPVPIPEFSATAADPPLDTAPAPAAKATEQYIGKEARNANFKK